MAKITAFSKTNLKQIRKDIEKALEEVSKKHGVIFKFNNIRFDNDTMRMKLEGFIGEPSDDGGSRPELIQGLKSTGSLYGLDIYYLDIEFIFSGKKMVFKGIDTKKIKYPIIAQIKATGKWVKLTKGAASSIKAVYKAGGK